MKTKNLVSLAVICAFCTITLILCFVNSITFTTVHAQTSATPVPFDQKAAIAALKEQIKGHENDLAPVFKNIKFMTTVPAARLLAVMEVGFSRSLGVDCTHCHVPGKWEAEDKPEKQIARDMSDMNTKINKELLRNIKNLKDANPIVNCTTCHRGQVKPATNMPTS